MSRLLVSVSLVTGLTLPVQAHTVQRAGEVAALWHVEPNHNPRAGQPALVWVALTRRGGQPIPNRQVDCRLTVRREPQGKEMLTSRLAGINVEQYRDTPSAKITFPQPGRYQLLLACQPKIAGLRPFRFAYSVTVGR